MDEEKDFQRAKELAINYISYRPRSSNEVKSHLIHKGYPLPMAYRVVDYLTQAHYLDDSEFAQKWYLSRLQKGGYGPFLIRNELMTKGIPSETCQDLRERFYPEKREREEAIRLLEKRVMDALRDPREKGRQYRMLIRRGFSSAIAMQVLGMKGTHDTQQEK
jgi:regulatory protein